MLVFGEDDHDRQAVRALVEGFRPELRGKVELRRRPLVLIKNARPGTARRNADDIVAVVRADHATRSVLAVLAHEDCDAVEPAHIATAERIEAELAAAACPVPAIGVTPAWEIEAWWLVFPEAVTRLVEGWRTPDDYLGRDVGQVVNAKEALRRALRPRKGPPPRDYEEKDSVPIARGIADDGLLASFRDGRRLTKGKGAARRETRCASLERFRASLLAVAGPK